MKQEIMRGFFAGPYVTLSKISEILERNKEKIDSLGITLPEIDPPKEYLMKAIEKQLQENPNLRNIPSSTNQIFIPLDGYGAMASRLIVRSGKKELVEKQFLMEKFIYDSTSRKNKEMPSFSKPLGLVNIDDKYFYILKRIHGESLADKFASSVDYEIITEEINRALNNFALFHGKLEKKIKDNPTDIISHTDGGRTISYEIKKFDYLENLIERAVAGKNPDLVKSLVESVDNKNPEVTGKYERLGYNKYLFPFLKEYKAFVKKNLSDILFETCLHGDAYSTNVLEGGVIIDPKPLKKGNPVLDISHFLISPEFRGVVDGQEYTFLDRYLTRLVKQKKYYFSRPRWFLPKKINKRVNNFFSDRRINKIRETYNPNVIHNSICLVGSMLSQNRIEDARYFLKLAENSMEQSGNHRLKKSFDNYIKNSKNAKHKGLFDIKVGVDFDGVISDATKLKIETAKRDYGIDLQPKDCSESNAEHAGMSKEYYEQMVRKIYSTPSFLNAEKSPGAKEIINRLIEKGNEVYIITSRSDEETAIAKEWLDREGIHYTKLINLNYQSKVQACKEYNLDVFIDDTHEKLVKLADHGLELYLFSTPANENVTVKSSEIKRLNKWEDFGIMYALS